MNGLTRSIIQTVSYFDIFDYPLTDREVYTFLHSEQTYTFGEVREALSSAPVEEDRGFYFLKGRRAIVDIRQERYVQNRFKMKKARRACAVWAYVPFVRMVAVCNNLSFFNAKKESDLDLFIVVEKNAMPFVRLVTVFLSILFFKRPTVQSAEDAVCLSFFVDRTHVALTDLTHTDDIYMKYWAATLLPLYDENDQWYAQFLKSNAALLKSFQGQIPRTSHTLRITVVMQVKKIFELLCTPFVNARMSSLLFSFQVKRLPKRISTAMNSSTSVVVTPSIFKTHITDARDRVQKTWERRVHEIAA